MLPAMFEGLTTENNVMAQHADTLIELSSVIPN